jgi:hypothetical protein
MSKVTEKQWWMISAVAVTFMGLAEFLRHQHGWPVALSTALVVIEIIAMIVGIVAIFSWARLRERQKRRSK